MRLPVPGSIPAASGLEPSALPGSPPWTADL